MTTGGSRAGGWTGRHLAVLAGGLLLAAGIRALLLPTPGLRDDIDQFAAWIHGLVSAPFGRAYDQNLSFPPVMVYVWGLLGAVEPAFRTVSDAADPGIRAIMKAPASLADLGLALGVGFALRERPWWAVAGALGIALHPAVIDVSAWWGQYESLYVLPALGAYLVAVRGHGAWAAALLAVALMTKPQALPFVVPFAAWLLAREGPVGAARAAAVGAAVIVVLWLPFVAAGGPGAYLRNLAEYQGGVFAILSLRAWNPWWLFQEAFAGGQFVADSAAVLGPVTLRMIGLALAGLAELWVFWRVLRSPTPRALALGLAASTLVAFTFLTTMHERYAFGALVFLALLLPDRRVLAVWIAFSVVFTLNLLAAVPPTDAIAALLPVSGILGIAGSLAMTAITAAVLWLLAKEPPP